MLFTFYTSQIHPPLIPDPGAYFRSNTIFLLHNEKRTDSWILAPSLIRRERSQTGLFVVNKEQPTTDKNFGIHACWGYGSQRSFLGNDDDDGIAALLGTVYIPYFSSLVGLFHWILQQHGRLPIIDLILMAGVHIHAVLPARIKNSS